MSPRHKPSKYDVSVRRESSLFLFQILTPAAQTWIEENVGDDAPTWGDALIVEHRFALDLASGMVEAGLRVH